MKLIKEYKTVYCYEELTEETKERVLNNYWDINIDHEWWEMTYDQFEGLGINVAGFNLEHYKCEINLIDDPDDIAKSIIDSYKRDCDLYQAARDYLFNRYVLFGDYSIDEYDIDDHLDGEMEDFKEVLEAEFLSILKNEYEYLTSTKQIEETLISNGYEFNEQGEIA